MSVSSKTVSNHFHKKLENLIIVKLEVQYVLNKRSITAVRLIFNIREELISGYFYYVLFQHLETHFMFINTLYERFTYSSNIDLRTQVNKLLVVFILV